MKSNEEQTNDTEEVVKQAEDVKVAFARRVEGTRKSATFYIINGYLFRLRGTKSDGIIQVNCLHGFQNKMSAMGLQRCQKFAYLDQDSLLITKLVGEHSCNQDPELSIQLCMETEMKQLAATTSDDLRDIFDKIGMKNPNIAARIPFARIYAAMKTRRLNASPHQNL